jgi:hypothetical protein
MMPVSRLLLLALLALACAACMPRRPDRPTPWQPWSIGIQGPVLQALGVGDRPMIRRSG